MLKRILVWLIAFLAWPCVAAPVVSGDYGGLLIGVDRNGSLTGYFESSTGRGQFSCIFFVSGKVSGSAANLDTWFPGDRDPKEVIHGVTGADVIKRKTSSPPETTRRTRRLLECPTLRMGSVDFCAH